MNPPGAGSPAPPAKADSEALLYLRRNTVSSFQEPTPSSLSCPFQIPTWREKRSFNFKVALNTCTRPTKVKTLSSQASESQTSWESPTPLPFRDGGEHSSVMEGQGTSPSSSRWKASSSCQSQEICISLFTCQAPCRAIHGVYRMMLTVPGPGEGRQILGRAAQGVYRGFWLF